ncbi:hypothetical protein GQR58_028609 [Nymphon striatum]|nr:hypothetical protein GQR58_028609 [Nymphon striatum]
MCSSVLPLITKNLGQGVGASVRFELLVVLPMSKTISFLLSFLLIFKDPIFGPKCPYPPRSANKGCTGVKLDVQALLWTVHSGVSKSGLLAPAAALITRCKCKKGKSRLAD